MKPSPTDIAEDIQEESYLDILKAMTDAELGEFAYETDRQLRKFRERANMAAGELLRRRPEGAKLHDFGDVLVTYTPTWSGYQYDIEALQRVFRPYLTGAEWMQVLREEVIPEHIVETVNTPTATAIAKKRGKLALEAFESCRTRSERDTRLSFQKIPPLEKE